MSKVFFLFLLLSIRPLSANSKKSACLNFLKSIPDIFFATQFGGPPSKSIVDRAFWSVIDLILPATRIPFKVKRAISTIYNDSGYISRHPVEVTFEGVKVLVMATIVYNAATGTSTVTITDYQEELEEDIQKTLNEDQRIVFVNGAPDIPADRKISEQWKSRYSQHRNAGNIAILNREDSKNDDEWFSEIMRFFRLPEKEIGLVVWNDHGSVAFQEFGLSNNIKDVGTVFPYVLKDNMSDEGIVYLTGCYVGAGDAGSCYLSDLQKKADLAKIIAFQKSRSGFNEDGLNEDNGVNLRRASMATANELMFLFLDLKTRKRMQELGSQEPDLNGQTLRYLKGTKIKILERKSVTIKVPPEK